MRIFCTGFSLIELLIALVIMGILTAMGLPLYSQYVREARRLEAATALTKLALAMENYHSQYQSYQHATLKEMGFSEFTGKKQYQLSIPLAKTEEYVLMATPVGDEAQKDSMCGALVLNAWGEKKITGSGQVEDCW